MESITPIILLIGGLALGFLLKFGARSGDDDGSTDLDGIDTIERAERERIESARVGLERDRDIIRQERERLERERIINDRAADLLAELERRASEEDEW